MNAILISIKMGTLPMNKKDDGITDATIIAANAKTEAGRWVNTLWPYDALRDIRKAEAAIRAHLYTASSPFNDSGDRIIPAAATMLFLEKHRTLADARQEAVDSFIREYPVWLNKAREMRGALFNSSEYLTPHKARARFWCQLNTKPIPSTSHFAKELQEVESIKNNLQSQIDAGIATAKADIAARITKPLEAFLDRAHNDPTSITAATVRTIAEIADVVATLDFDGTFAPTIALIRGLQLDSAAIRESSYTRGKAVAAVDDILTKFMPPVSKAS